MERKRNKDGSQGTPIREVREQRAEENTSRWTEKKDRLQSSFALWQSGNLNLGFIGLIQRRGQKSKLRVCLTWKSNSKLALLN